MGPGQTQDPGLARFAANRPYWVGVLPPTACARTLDDLVADGLSPHSIQLEADCCESDLQRLAAEVTAHGNDACDRGRWWESS